MRGRAAHEAFFHGFVGAIVYGHGDVRAISGLTRFVVSFVADTCFLVVSLHLVAVLTCAYPAAAAPALVLDPSVECWSGALERAGAGRA